MRVRGTVHRNVANGTVRGCLSIMSCSIIISGCSLGDLVNRNGLPAEVQDPAAVKTPAGALGAYFGALSTLSSAFGQYFVLESGLIADELQVGSARTTSTNDAFPVRDGLIDSRLGHDNQSSGNSYSALHKVRGHAREAIGALRAYYPSAPPALVGHLFAIEGMANVLLAELYCSGIPLSLLEFQGDYTLKSAATTEEVFRTALALFDSALVLSVDSSRIMQLAYIGRARALVGLHDLPAASEAAGHVQTDFVYRMMYTYPEFIHFVATSNRYWYYSVVDKEGINGLPYLSSGDPRTVADSLPTEYGSWIPRKYLPAGISDPADNPGTAPITFANGIEARLIEAEAAFAENTSDWLIILNAVRTSCLRLSDCPDPAPAGSGGIADLPPLTDPGLAPLPPGKTADDIRLDLIFHERAFWLFLTGHRQGDMRRLVTQYRRPADTVYPVGPWGRLRQTYFGSDITLPVPQEEFNNPLYRGCLSRD